MAAMTCESTQPTLNAATVVRCICTIVHSRLRRKQLQGKIRDDHVTELQQVNLHVQERRAMSWRI